MSRIEGRIKRIRERVSNALHEIADLVDELRVQDGVEHLVAEELSRLGSAALPAINDVLHDTSASEAALFFAALVGFDAGDRELCREVLLGEIARAGDYGPLAARHMARVGDVSAVASVQTALGHTPDEDVDSIVAYLEVLHQLDAYPEPNEGEALATHPDWRVRTAMAQWYGHVDR